MSPRTGFTGSALIRLLARLTDKDVPESRQAFADRLGRWVGWTDAISLSAALGTCPAPPVAVSRGPVLGSDPGAGQAERDRVRASLAQPLGVDTPAAADFLPHRRRYQARQQAMEASIGPLRQCLRTSLAAGSPNAARLATMDATMEQLMAPRERTLLSAVPVLLERHFERLRQAEAPDGATGAWLGTFRQDIQSVLLAELEVRLQPVDGLLDALRSH